MSLISIEDLKVSYGRREVISSLDWEIGEGVTGLIGPNGSGKSTLLNVLTGLIGPQGGRVDFDRSRGGAGRDGLSVIGYVPQAASAPSRMRVHEIVEYCAWLNGVPSRDCGRLTHDALQRLNLSGLASRRFGTLSGGEKRKAMIATGMVHRPEILILDEPTVGLDPGQRLAVRRAIACLDHLRGVLMATHLVEDVEHLCSNIGLLHHGRISYSGPVRGLLSLVPDSSGEPTGQALGSPFEMAYERLVGESSHGARPTSDNT